MSNKLYVGNLSFRVTNEDLHDYFAAAGAVESANVVFDRETGRSRGFGFVEMASEDDANNAIAQFNGQEYDGRNMVVNEARPREDRGGAAAAARRLIAAVAEATAAAAVVRAGKYEKRLPSGSLFLFVVRGPLFVVSGRSVYSTPSAEAAATPPS